MKKTGVLLFFLLVCLGKASPFCRVNADSILTILQQKESLRQHKHLVLSIRYYFSGLPVNKLAPAKQQLNILLSRYKVSDEPAVSLFVQTMYLMELKRFPQAENELVHTIDLAARADDHYLLYACFIQLGFLQDLKGNATESIRSFGEARQEATQLNDAYLQVLVDIDISDIYHRNKLYSQSLMYLDQAQALIVKHRLKEPSFTMMIQVNKAENYFDIGNVDSLAKYSRHLFAMDLKDSSLYTFRQRSLYALELLRGQYDKALAHLAALKKDPYYIFDTTDEQNLAKALYRNGQMDSARTVARQLIADDRQRNHPEVTLPLYEMLARIAVDKQEKNLAIRRFDVALQQAKMQLSRLEEVDTIAARLKLDEMRNKYVRREEGFKREQLWLIFSFITVTLILIAGAMFYRSMRQKRHLEKLLFESKRNELSFINSHQVRRHVSNILGIIDAISHSDNGHEAYLEAETYLLRAAESLDASIQEIADKLNG